ncbi:class I SAM-dependent methyltransferase [Candidatus Pacearchaeota archaeon]|nr:class I SAM-dependent methyltransferase [Candidatus Pacearchaeota archaeon]
MDCVEKIRSLKLEYLRDQTFLEDLIVSMGLNENMKEFLSPFLYKYCNINGLKTTQLPKQFAEYLIYLSKMHIESYLEIGVRFGGAFIITVEYLKRFNEGFHTAACIDVKPIQTNLLRYKDYHNFEYVYMNSRKPEVKEWIKDKVFDLVLIDGDHSYEGCRNDYDLVRGKAKIIALHDHIMIDGVKKVWNEVRSNYKFSAGFEDQYEDAIPTRPEYIMYEKHLGLGILIGEK